MKKASEQPLHGSLVSDTAIKQPVMITMLMLLLLVAGLICYSSLPVNLMPDFELGTISIQVVYGGAGSEVLADQVAKPIEDAVSTISGVKSVTSTSNENYTVIAVGLNDGVNADQALQSVRESVASIRSSLPDGISEPVYQKADLSMSPVVTLAITSRSGQDPLLIRQQIEDMVLPQIQSVPGVGTATLSGGVERQVNVLLDLGRLQALGVMPSTVSSAIAAANTNLSLGSTMVGDQEYSLRSPSVFSTTADIATVGLGNGYTIGDVATVQDGTADVDAYTRFNGKDAFSLAIRKQSGTNTAAVATAALAALDRALTAYPDIEYHVVANQADQVRENVDGAIEEIVLAVLLAMLVVWIFFRNIRNTIITVIGLPLIIVASFMGLQLFGISLNIVSLLALSVSAGLVVDDAIVVRENIFRRLEQGDTPRVAASQGTAQVSFSVLAMTLTVIAVFLPAALTNGLVGTLFKAFGVTVAAAMAISLLEAFTLGPMLASRFLKQQPAHPLHIKPGEEHLPDEAHQELGKMERAFERLTTWTLRRRGVTMLIVVVVLALGIAGSAGIKFAFIPDLNVAQMAMAFDMPSGTPLERTDAMARTVEQRLMADPEVDSVLTNVGGNAGVRHAEYAIRLRDGAQAVDVQERLRAQMTDVPEAVFALATSQGTASTDISGRALLLQIRTAGDTQSLLPIVQQLRESFKDVPGLTDVGSSYIPGAPELQYRLRQSAANDYGLSNQALAVTMRTLVDGNTAAAFRDNGKSYDIVVRLRPEDRRSIDALQDVSLPLGSSMVPVRALADFQVASSASTVRRADRLTEVQIGGTNTGRVSSDVQADMQARIDKLQLPPGVTVSFGGQISSLNDGFTALFVALFLSVLLVYMVLASQFGSFTQPIVIMLAMPLSLIGAALGLRLAGEDFSILAFIGLLMLMGMVVKNSILLVDFTNKLREAGMEKHPALIRASAIRLRPILMTSLAVVLGNAPAVLGLGAGAEMRRGLAIVVAGGMIASTILALVVIPVAYSLMDSISTRVSRLFHRAPKPAPQAAD